jgi:hypothetical protein
MQLGWVRHALAAHLGSPYIAGSRIEIQALRRDRRRFHAKRRGVRGRREHAEQADQHQRPPDTIYFDHFHSYRENQINLSKQHAVNPLRYGTLIASASPNSTTRVI